MITYQDLLAVGQDEKERMAFIRKAIDQHKGTSLYRTAWIAEQYNAHRNVTISEYQKLLYTVTGKAVPDNWSANYKMACRHFHRFITQENQYLLGNGVTWGNPQTSDKIGNKRYPFDTQLQTAGRKALIGGVSFGFFNLDHVEVFSVLEFVPLYDEENGSMSAGIRFWQIDPDKPLRATLYELDGYTEYMWANGKPGAVYKDKRAYKVRLRQSEADGVEIFDFENYPTFPIVPLWANEERQSEIVGLREQIDCYDLIKSGFANTVDESSLIYWTIQNAGGMDDVDLAQFVERIKTVHAAVVEDDGAKAESHTMEAPYQSREALLERIDKDLYKDAMALDVERIAAGATTATQIRAAYEPLNSKTDGYEYCVLQFIQGILSVAGIEDEASFTRSMIVNVQEEVQSIVAAGTYLDPEYVTGKIMTLFGDADMVEDTLARMRADEIDMVRTQQAEEPAGEGEMNG